jgi:hypothetical protein
MLQVPVPLNQNMQAIPTMAYLKMPGMVFWKNNVGQWILPIWNK